MDKEQYNTPILFLVFNRPETTQKVFDAIKEIKPKQLFIAADGARNEKEKLACNEVKNIFKKIDWPCDVQTLYREKNLGCGRAVSSAITWFFTQVEEGIILEDDTLPNKSFFSYCAYILKKYRNDASVMHVAGFNYDFFKKIRTKNSHFFANAIAIWGWATWRRAWNKYDFEMKGFEEKEDTLNCKDYYKEVLRKTYKKQIDTWDYQWMYAIFSNKGKTVVPKNNLVINLGFGSGATHTTVVPKWNSLITRKEIRNFNDKEPILYSSFYEQLVISNTVWEKYTLLQRLFLRYKNIGIKNIKASKERKTIF